MKLDDHGYWVERHKKVKDLSSVGQRKLGQKGNEVVYETVKVQYARVLKALKVEKGINVLDAGAGIGFFSYFLKEKGFDVTAIDISKEGLRKIEKKGIKAHTSKIADFKKGNYKIVHCFDVLYHILDDREWQDSVTNLCNRSNSYVILHQRFLRREPLFLSPHLAFRSYSRILEEMNKNGFREILSMPSHVLMRNPIYILAKILPGLFRSAEMRLLKKWPFDVIDIASHHIKVFEKVSASRRDE